MEDLSPLKREHCDRFTKQFPVSLLHYFQLFLVLLSSAAHQSSEVCLVWPRAATAGLELLLTGSTGAKNFCFQRACPMQTFPCVLYQTKNIE